jgi:hypothetical protein
MRQAKIESGVVTEIIQADDVFVAGLPGEWVKAPAAVANGWLFNGTDFQFPNGNPYVPAPPAPVLRTRLSRREFRNQFSQAEKQGIYSAAELSIDIRIFLDDLAAADFIDLEDPQTAASVQALEAGGLISAARVAEILTGVAE